MFEPSTRRTLRAAIDRIIPEDEYPSASQAGVMEFLERLIPEQDLEQFYWSGLAGLDEEAFDTFSSEFAECSPEQQDEILRTIENGIVAMPWKIDPAEFFRTLATQTIEGYYCDPGNGGNRDQIAWKMIGYKVSS